ncbi:glycine cleavage system protein H, partial [Brachybacterium squillarum]
MSDEIRYSKDHEWVRIDADGHAVIGVTDFAAGQLGDVVYVDLPAVGDELTAGTEMGEIESTKSVSDLFSPIDGTVLEQNQEVVDAP